MSLIITSDIEKCLKEQDELFSQHKRAFKKCNVLWAKSKRPSASETIKKIVNCCLKTPCVTRWNSIFDSLTQLMSMKHDLNKILKELKATTVFEDCDLKYLSAYCEIVKPIAAAIDNLQGDKHTYFGYLIPTIVTILVTYRKLGIKFSENASLLLLVDTIRLNIKNRFIHLYSINSKSE